MQDAKTFFGQALEHHLAGDWPAAEKAYRRALELSPERPNVLFNLGRLMMDLHRDGEAEAFFARVVASSPRDFEAQAALGVSLAHLGRHAEALECHARALAIAPDNPELHASFGGAAAYARLRADEIRSDALEPALLVCLEGDSVNHQNLAHVASIVRRAKHESAWDAADVRAPSVRALMADRLVQRSLEKIIVSNEADESFFTRLRRSLLLTGAMKESAAFLCALACQCFLNEYIWDTDGEELAALERAALAPPSLERFALLSCYRKPARDDVGGCAIPPQLMLRLIVEPEVEAAIAGRLPRGLAIDAVSRDVSAMYEENPYPRWTAMAAERTLTYVERILAEIAPHAPKLEPAAARPRILVAGGGTGRDPLTYARYCSGAEVRAIDLSRASLAYAQRKAEEFDVSNLELAQQDILTIEEEAAYDVVSCLGVLHHMAEPEAGLKRLVRALKPGGFLMLALYSAAARRDVTQVRALIAREGYEPTPEGIRKCRQHVRRELDGPLRGLMLNTPDFYSMSMARDLLFHVQEHQFTLPQIEALLERHGLEFLGFRISDPAVKALYHAHWPDDGAMIDLGRWARLEEQHSTLFRAMYQFWTRKTSRPTGKTG